MTRRKLSEAVRVMEGTLVAGSAEGWWQGASLDSRALNGGELFFALAGANTDGHLFVAAACSAGAKAAVIEREVRVAAPESFPLVRVRSSLGALHALTRSVRKRTPEKLVAITGSAGKTTTKELLAVLLATEYRVAASPGNYNNLHGFPLALLGVPEETEWMVAEMAMSTPGELGGVSRLGRPDVAVFTNVLAVHLEAFDHGEGPGGLRAIAEAKAELLEGLAPTGLVVANAADPEVVRIAERHSGRGGRVAWFALDPELTTSYRPRLEVVGLSTGQAQGTSFGSSFQLLDRDSSEQVSVELALHGKVNVENFLAAATCARELGVSMSKVVAATRGFGAAAGRGEILRVRGATVVDDSYNSNPEALVQAVLAAAELPGRRHWAVVGEMLELGERAADLHREAGRRIAEAGLDLVFGVGTLARELVAECDRVGVPAFWFSDAASAAQAAQEQLREGDVVVVKGSRGVALDRVVQVLSQDLVQGEE